METLGTQIEIGTPVLAFVTGTQTPNYTAALRDTPAGCGSLQLASGLALGM